MPVHCVLQTKDVCVTAPSGRTLFRDLTLTLEAGDRVALVGRNGVGKSTLLEVLAGITAPASGRVIAEGTVVFVPQQLAEPASASPGQRRRSCLERVLAARPDALLLDEPTRDLDAAAVQWLCQQLNSFAGALLVVSHDRRLLQRFGDFFVAADAGSRHYRGAFAQVLDQLEAERLQSERYYLRQLSELDDREQHNDRLRRRRERKKNLGRIRELKRCPARAKLNAKRGYAQVSQGKRALLQAERIDSTRRWTKAARRALAVELALDLAPPNLPASRAPVIVARGLSTCLGERTLFRDLHLDIDRQRVAITGPNGSGKTTLVETLLGQRAPDAGEVRVDSTRVGFIAQNASNWARSESLVDLLCPASTEAELEHCAQKLHTHRFPLALAARSLHTLSPGERVRAALIALFERTPAPELLVLDEPTDALDLLGLTALERTLAAWPGGLLVVSHDDDSLHRIGIGQILSLA